MFLCFIKVKVARELGSVKEAQVIAEAGDGRWAMMHMAQNPLSKGVEGTSKNFVFFSLLVTTSQLTTKDDHDTSGAAPYLLLPPFPIFFVHSILYLLFYYGGKF